MGVAFWESHTREIHRDQLEFLFADVISICEEVSTVYAYERCPQLKMPSDSRLCRFLQAALNGVQSICDHARPMYLEARICRTQEEAGKNLFGTMS